MLVGCQGIIRRLNDKQDDLLARLYDGTDHVVELGWEYGRGKFREELAENLGGQQRIRVGKLEPRKVSLVFKREREQGDKWLQMSRLNKSQCSKA